MQLEHHFTVPVPPDVAWEALLDPERVAPCFPGATLQSAAGSEFTGTVKVRLGPVALMYKGKGAFTATDPEARRTVIEASAKDTRGNGTAAANVAVTVRPDDEGAAVDLTTELKITGRPAQLGRGLISDVSGKIVATFADCLATRLAERPSSDSAGSGVSRTYMTGPAGSADAPRSGAPELTSPADPPTSAGTPNSEGSAGSVGSVGSAGSVDATGSVGAAGSAGSVGAAGRSNSAGRSGSAGWSGSEGSVRWSVSADSSGSTESGGKGAGQSSDASVPSEINLIEVAGAPVLKRVALLLVGFVLLLVIRKLFRHRR